MELIKLIEFKEESIRRGMVFRLPAQWPYEEYVDFMVIDLFDTHGLIVSSGYKAGLILISLPEESKSKEGRALSTNWLITNWEKWIYPECNVNDVYLLEGYKSKAINK